MVIWKRTRRHVRWCCPASELPPGLQREHSLCKSVLSSGLSGRTCRKLLFCCGRPRRGRHASVPRLSLLSGAPAPPRTRFYMASLVSRQGSEACTKTDLLCQTPASLPTSSCMRKQMYDPSWEPAVARERVRELVALRFVVFGVCVCEVGFPLSWETDMASQKKKKRLSTEDDRYVQQIKFLHAKHKGGPLRSTLEQTSRDNNGLSTEPLLLRAHRSGSLPQGATTFFDFPLAISTSLIFTPPSLKVAVVAVGLTTTEEH